MSMVRIQEHVRENDIPALLTAEIHDEVDYLVEAEVVDEFAEDVRKIMEDISWLERFNVELDIPILADVGVGEYWGEVE